MLVKTLETIYTEMAFGLGNAESITLQGFMHLIKTYDESNKGAQPISFTSVTNPQYRKTGFPYGMLYKVGQTNGMLGFDYSANVNAQRAREDKPTNFKAEPTSKVREWLSPSIGITATGLTVIKYRPLASQPPKWVVTNSSGTGNFEQIGFDEVKEFLYEPGKIWSQGVDQDIQYRLYGVDKIIAVSFQKKEYIITDADPTRIEIFNVVKAGLKS